MEQINKVIVTMVYYNSLIRDTLEYTLARDEYKTEYYNYKRQGLTNELKVNSPLKIFLEKNGEKGEKLRKEIEEFIELFYSDNSTIIKQVDNKIEVDHAQNVLIFEKTIPIHESINNIINLHKDIADKQGQKDELIENLLKADERFYRAVALLSISSEIKKLFEEFNKVMNESKGVKTPQANFIENDLTKLIQLLHLTKQQARCTDEIYTRALDDIFNYIEMVTGKRDLPKGKTFVDVHNEIGIALSVFVEDAESKWKEYYKPAIETLAKENKEAAEKEANKS